MSKRIDYKKLEERKPEWKHREKTIKEFNEEVSTTIRMLESRVVTSSIDLDLGDGFVVGIRTNLSSEEVSRLQSILDSRKEILSETVSMKENKSMDQSTIEAYETIFDNLWYDIIEMITVDNSITSEWLKNNKDKYSNEDLLSMWLAYLEGQKRISESRKERIQKAISFREDFTR